MKLETQVTGNIGLYYVCYHLSRLGWNVMPTSRNARGIDVIAYDRTGAEFIGVQVKALTKRNPVPLGNSLDKVMGDFWVIVNNIRKEPQTYVLLPEEVKSWLIGAKRTAGLAIGCSQNLTAWMSILRLGIALAGAIKPLTSRCSTFPARGPSTGRHCRGAAKLSVMHKEWF